MITLETPSQPYDPIRSLQQKKGAGPFWRHINDNILYCLHKPIRNISLIDRIKDDALLNSFFIRLLTEGTKTALVLSSFTDKGKNHWLYVKTQYRVCRVEESAQIILKALGQERSVYDKWLGITHEEILCRFLFKVMVLQTPTEELTTILSLKPDITAAELAALKTRTLFQLLIAGIVAIIQHPVVQAITSFFIYVIFRIILDRITGGITFTMNHLSSYEDDISFETLLYKQSERSAAFFSGLAENIATKFDTFHDEKIWQQLQDVEDCWVLLAKNSR